MTLVNAILRPEAVYVLTDGLVTKGNHDGFAQKILPITHLNDCLCVRGNGVLVGTLMQFVWSQRKTFAEAADNLGSDYKSCVDGLLAHNIPADARGEAYLIGWDNEAGAPEIWIAPNYDLPDQPAYTAKRSNGLTMHVPGVSDRIKALAADAMQPHSTSGLFDPRRDGAELIAAQAAEPDSLSGGFCHLTTIYPNRIEMEILARFDG